MKNQKGQALVEFVLILPLFLLLVMGMIDLGNILYERYTLEANLDYVVDLYQNEKTTALDQYLQEANYTLEVEKEDEMTTLILKEQTKIATPILKDIIGSTYKLETKRIIYEEVK